MNIHADLFLTEFHLRGIKDNALIMGSRRGRTCMGLCGGDCFRGCIEGDYECL